MPSKGEKLQEEIFLTCSTSGAFVRFTSTAVQAGMVAQMTLPFEFKLSSGALYYTATIIKESFEAQGGIITNSPITCSLNLECTDKKNKIYFLHSIDKSLCTPLLHFPDLIDSICWLECQPCVEPGLQRWVGLFSQKNHPLVLHLNFFLLLSLKWSPNVI